MNNRFKKRNRSITDVLIPVICFHGLIINMSPGNAIGQYIQMLCCLTSIGFFISKYTYNNTNVKKILWGILFLFISMSISTYLVRSQNVIGTTKLASPYTPILLSCQLLSFLGLSVYSKRINKWGVMFGVLYIVTTIYIVIMSEYALSLGRNEDPNKYFIFQNKFNFSYLMAFWVALYRVLHPRFSLWKKLILLLHIVFSLFMTSWVGCTTGMLVIIFLWIAFTFENQLSYFLCQKKLLFFSLPTIDLLFFFFYTFILSIPNVNYFIEIVLGKSSTLTGRIYIYSALKDIIGDRPFWGVGPRNGTATMAYFLGMPNAQNGLLYTYLELGLVGIFFYFYIYLLNIRNVKLGTENYGILAFLYGMILSSIVEITMDISFLCYSFLLLTPNIYYRLQKVK